MKMRVKMKKILFFCAVGLVLIFAGSAGASLIGDIVTVEHKTNSRTIFGPQDTVVTDGTADTVAVMTPSHNYDVNVDAYSINVDFVSNLSWSPIYNFNGLVVSSLDDSSGNSLQGVSIDTNMSGWDASRLAFTDDQVLFNWRALSFTTDTYFNASLDFGQNPVPIPGAVWLLGSGLLGLAAVRRKKSPGVLCGRSSEAE